MKRRQLNRVCLPKEIQLGAFLVLPEPYNEIVTATVTDLSVGGVRLRMTRKEIIVHPGDHLVLKQIKGPPELKSVADIEMEIMWTHKDEKLGLIVFGCQFLNISQPIREQIKQFTDIWTVIS